LRRANRLIVVPTMLLALMVFASSAIAAPGGLDPTFGGGDGEVVTDLGGSDSASDVALQSDGKIVVVGRSREAGMILARYNADGSPDTSFGGGDGLVVGGDGSGPVRIEPSGKIVVAGTKVISEGEQGEDRQYGAVLRRFNADGSIDTTFGGGTGQVTTDFGTAEVDDPLTAEFQPDGKLIVAGQAYTSEEIPGFGQVPSADFVVGCFNADGSVDTTFGGGTGVVQTDFGGHDQAYAITVQSDGKIVVGGTSSADYALARYNADGTLDTSFGGGTGKVVTDPGANGEFIFALSMQTDGKIVAVGAQVHNLAILRYNADGTLDTTFGGGDGFTTSEADQGGEWPGYTGAEANAVAVEPDGRILVAGGLYNLYEPATALFVSRYNPNGALDHSYGNGGKVVTPFGAGSSFGTEIDDIALQPDGSLLAAGGTGGPNYDVALVRYEGGGGPIPTYHRLTIGKSGAGSGFVYGGGVACGLQCGTDVETGEPVTVEAIPDEGSEFKGWAGACSGSSPTCEVVMTSDESAIAMFVSTGGGEEEPPAEEEQREPPSEEHHDPPAGGGTPNPAPTPLPTPEPTPEVHRKPLKCHKGFKKLKIHGKAKCVKVKRGRQSK
jgi:uncharacterized delta-60 repeat protein